MRIFLLSTRRLLRGSGLRAWWILWLFPLGRQELRLAGAQGAGTQLLELGVLEFRLLELVVLVLRLLELGVLELIC